MFASLILFIAFITLEPCSATNSPLSGKSFSVKTRIARLDKSYKYDLLLEESYSKPQNRAKIGYLTSDSLGNKRTVEFHFDAYSKHGLLYSRIDDTCEQMDLLQFYTSSMSFESEFIRLMQMEMANINPVIGPARLLMLVSAKTNLLKDPTEFVLFGANVIKYSLEIPMSDDKDSRISLRVYYDKSTYDPGKLDDLLPISIGWQTTWLQYVKLEIDHEMDQHSRNFAHTADIVIDEFAIPATSECIKSLPKYGIYSLYEMQSFRFSFEAETLDPGGFSEHYWIQFDGLQQVLRVDSHQQGRNDIKSAIFNFRTNKRYLISAGPEVGGEEQCLAIDNLGRSRADLKMSNLLTGEGSLGLVGRATVRGAQALVLAALSDHLPYWFDQPVLYKVNNTEALRRRDISPANLSLGLSQTISNKDNPAAGGRKRYKILVYLEASRSNRLLAIEVYDILYDESELRLLIEIRDFVWQLAETADGRPPSDIFVLADSCSARHRDDHYLEVDLLLRQASISAMANASSQGTWIRDWPLRNLATSVGLIDSLDLDCTMVHGLESSVQFEPKMALEVHFRLSEQAQLLRSLKLIGRANLKPTGNCMEFIEIHHRVGPLLLTDCLSLAVAKNQMKISPTYVYYSEQHSQCLLDPALDGADERELSKSLIIEIVQSPMDQSATGELYQVETHLDYSSQASILKDKRLDGLENRIVILTHTTGVPVQPIDPAIFDMRIERMSLRSHNYYLDSGEAANQQVSYRGVAFLADCDTSRLIEAYNEAQSITLAQCQAACLADYKCNSYSYCILFPGAECILSEVSISDALGKDLATQLRDQSDRIISIKASPAIITLRRDARCELHRRSHLANFIRGDKERNVLYGHWTIPVDNIEECAQSCFMKTLKVLKSMDDATSDRDEHLSQLCTRFLYLNAILNDAQRQAIREAIGVSSEFNTDTHSGGYCLIRHSFDTNRDSSLNVFFNFDYYDFDFTSLYEKKSGISLLDTSNELEKATLVKLYNGKPRQEDHEILERADREGRNVQAKLMPSSSDRRCAQLCLMQTTSLLPACRSFDVIQIRQTELRQPYLICQFNTKLANESQLEHHDGASASLSVEQRWHYEPRWDLIKRAIELEAHDARSRTRLTLRKDPADWLPGALVVTVLVVLAKISGIILGITLARRLISQTRQAPRSLCKDNESDIALE